MQDRADSEVKEATSEDYASMQLTLTPQAAASSGVWGGDHPASPPYRHPTDDRMPEIQAHVTMGLLGQAPSCAKVVIGADAGGAVLNLMTGDLQITNQQKQVCAPPEILLYFSTITYNVERLISCSVSFECCHCLQHMLLQAALVPEAS